MFKKLLLILLLSFSGKTLFSMSTKPGSPSKPEFCFDKIELGLNAVDYVLEACKIAAMSPTSQSSLRILYGLGAINKFLIGSKKLYRSTKLGNVEAIRALVDCGSNGNAAIRSTKNNLSTNKKIIQFASLSLNKLAPIIAYLVTKWRCTGGHFGKHLFYTTGDKPSKKASMMYGLYSIITTISETCRSWHQDKVIKRLRK